MTASLWPAAPLPAAASVLPLPVPTGRYTLVTGLPVLVRGPRSVQIGVDPPLCLVLRHAPRETPGVLDGLDGTRPLADVLARARADPAVWLPLVSELIDRGFVVPVEDWCFPGVGVGAATDVERHSLVHRLGLPVAQRVIATRLESVVAVRGAGALPDAVHALLRSAGVGTLRTARSARTAPGRDDRRIPGGSAGRAAAPDLLLLFGPADPLPWDLAELATDQVPHLAVRAGTVSASVGPLVLPGRSTCLMCVTRHRLDADPEWSLLQAALREQRPLTPPGLLSAVAAVTAAEVLSLLDGLSVPVTVDGALDFAPGEVRARRRSWPAHPDCRCRHPRRAGSESRARPGRELGDNEACPRSPAAP